MTVSFYIVNDALSKTKVQSMIKFDAMEKIILGTKWWAMSIFRTINKTTWRLRSNTFALGTTRLADET